MGKSIPDYRTVGMGWCNIGIRCRGCHGQTCIRNISIRKSKVADTAWADGKVNRVLQMVNISMGGRYRRLFIQVYRKCILGLFFDVVVAIMLAYWVRCETTSHASMI